MLIFYNIGIRLYYFGVFVASFFNPKAKKWLDGRKNVLVKIEQEVSSFSGETVWVHCASLGEFEMARPIMEELKKTDSTIRIVLTFFSPSGYEVRKDYALANHVFYLPLDTKENTKRFVHAIRPNKVIFVKYDLWFHYLNESKKVGAKLILISAQFRKSQQYFKFYGSTGRSALNLFDQIFLVDENSKQLLQSIGVEKTTVCGDTRYDRVMEVANAAEAIPSIETFKADLKLVICGSTWPEDEKLLSYCISQFPDVKWIIAPHEVGEENIQRLEKLFTSTIRLSKFENATDKKILLIDSVGQLNKLYRYADAAYVGGGFKTGLHNVLEATAFGVPTVFGPNHSRFPDAGEMNAQGLAFSIKNEMELRQKLETLLNKDQTELQKNILAFMQNKTGATKAILEYTTSC